MGGGNFVGRSPTSPVRGDNRFTTVTRGNSIGNVCFNRSRGGSFGNGIYKVSLKCARNTKFRICNPNGSENIHVVGLGGSNSCSACSLECHSVVNGGIGRGVEFTVLRVVPAGICSTIDENLGVTTILLTIVVTTVLLGFLFWSLATRCCFAPRQVPGRFHDNIFVL